MKLIIKRQGRREERAGDGAGERRERERVRKERREKKGSFKEEMGRALRMRYSICADKHDDHYLSY